MTATTERFDLYEALWLFCSRYHSGQWSRGYRILSRLDKAGFRPGLAVQQGRLESEEAAGIYSRLVANYWNKI